MIERVIQGDCREVLASFESACADLVYLDPPFFTRRDHVQTTRDGSKTYSFADTWESKDSYVSFLRERTCHIHRVLKSSGSVFFHCDRNATHLARLILEDVFGEENFRSEIVWHYRRWANDQNNLVPAHQTILFFSKTEQYKFNTLWCGYSPATNLDQIWQRRVRDHRNKAVYARDEDGNIVSNGSKKGVPLNDVWDIPYLNPKARERTGYPTQKPLLLLEKIIALVTGPGDLVVDPFCGSGTTLVAAKLLGRSCIGIDISAEAVTLTKQRLAEPVRSRSGVYEDGREAYERLDPSAAEALEGLEVLPVQRNKGIDAFLKATVGHGLIPVRVQRPHESVQDAVAAVYAASVKKGCRPMVVIKTHEQQSLLTDWVAPDEVLLVSSLRHSVQEAIETWKNSKTAHVGHPTELEATQVR